MQAVKKHTLSPGALRLILAATLPLALIALFEVLKSNQSLMGRWVFGVLAPVEQLFGRLWSWAPFSAAEVLTALFLTGCVLWLILSGVLLCKNRAPAPFLRRLAALAAVWLWLWAGLCWLWNAAYSAPSFVQRSGLEVEPYTVEDLAQVTEEFARQAATLAGQVARDRQGHFAEDTGTCFEQGVFLYENLARRFPCLAAPSVKAKPLLCSRLQSILGFTGVYFPFTGEANVNTDAPACLIPATIAHEMSHQRMVASEAEANFVGIAACITCDNQVFQYSGYLMGLIQLCNALFSVDPDAWYDIAGRTFSPELSQDWADNNAYWAALSSPVEEAAGEAYDAFLKGNGQELGMGSYGACVDLLVNCFGAGA